MISKFVREQKRYTQNELSVILECSDDEIVEYIRKLKEYGILKAVKASDIQKELSDLQDDDVEVADVEVGEADYLYIFTFVGVIVLAGRVLKCYPKYIQHNEEPINELKQVIKVLEKYNSKKQIIKMFNDTSESTSFNLLAVLLFLIQDYFENGTYSSTEDVVEVNGSGEILWDKTINDTFTIISNNRPYYTELQTKRRVNNDYDYVKRLHECLLTKASKELKESHLLDIFEMSEIDLSDERIDDFGEREYILNYIEKELNIQFNTRKQLVLKAIYAYISNGGSLWDIEGMSLFGTNSFNLVWEYVCADIMDNQLDKTLNTINLPIQLKPEYDGKQKLIDLIEKPLWTLTQKRAKDTLIPDLISIVKKDREMDFVIFDAKYYNAQLEVNVQPKGQPGIESVTKQYLYQLAYQKFIEDHKFNKVYNCFLLPTENEIIEYKGEVSMDMFEKLGLQNIKVRFIPAVRAYAYYLSGEKMDISDLKLYL